MDLLSRTHYTGLVMSSVCAEHAQRITRYWFSVTGQTYSDVFFGPFLINYEHSYFLPDYCCLSLSYQRKLRVRDKI